MESRQPAGFPFHHSFLELLYSILAQLFATFPSNRGQVVRGTRNGKNGHGSAWVDPCVAHESLWRQATSASSTAKLNVPLTLQAVNPFPLQHLVLGRPPDPSPPPLKTLWYPIFTGQRWAQMLQRLQWEHCCNHISGYVFGHPVVVGEGRKARALASTSVAHTKERLLLLQQPLMQPPFAEYVTHCHVLYAR